MADGTYQPKVYREQGGDRMVVASGGSHDVESGGEIDIESGAALKVAGSDKTAALADAVESPVAGIADGYKVARGTATPGTASDTIVSGLATVVAVVVSLKGAPSLTHFISAGDIGDQAGTPAAGSFLLKSYKPTGSGDVTPIAATTPWSAVDWIAIGT